MLRAHLPAIESNSCVLLLPAGPHREICKRINSAWLPSYSCTKIAITNFLQLARASKSHFSALSGKVLQTNMKWSKKENQETNRLQCPHLSHGGLKGRVSKTCPALAGTSASHRAIRRQRLHRGLRNTGSIRHLERTR